MSNETDSALIDLNTGNLFPGWIRFMQKEINRWNNIMADRQEHELGFAM